MVDRSALLVIVTSLSVAAPTLADETAARAAEDRAFGAIEEERWCDALFGFLEANEAAPSIDLIFNAALAADEAQDKKRSLKLYVELLDAYPDSDRGASVNDRIQKLTQEVQKDGAGTPCPEPPPPTAAAPPAGEASATETAPDDESAAPPPAPILPWAMTGAGAVLVLGGGALAAVGGAPYLEFLDVRDQILALEKTGGDAAALQARQASALEAWTGWGELTMWSGVATAVIGVGVMMGGVVWALLPVPEE